MEKSELPTPKRLSELREQGVAHCSFVTTRLAASGAALAAISLQHGEWSRFIDRLMGPLQSGAGEIYEPLLLYADLVEPAAKLFFVPLLAAAIVAVLVGTAQTRLLFHFKALTPDTGRLFNPAGLNPLPGLKRAAGALIAGAAALVLAGLCWAALVWEVVRSFTSGRSALTWSAGELGGSLAPVVILLISVAAVVSWFGSKYLFILRHRMSSEEIEQELRE